MSNRSKGEESRPSFSRAMPVPVSPITILRLPAIADFTSHATLTSGEHHEND